MFTLHSSNLAENLLQHLASVIQAKPLASPFEKELFLIQSQGMERWLSQQLASEFGVWGNAEFLFPAKFFNRLASTAGYGLQAENFDRFELIWHFEALLRDLSAKQLQPIANYLKHQAGSQSTMGSETLSYQLKRFYLARQLAMLFDQYQMMRPDLLSDWQTGRLQTDSPDELWQQALWQALTAQLGGDHRGVQWQKVIAHFQAKPAGEVTGLPERIHFFGLNTLPPLFLQFIQAFAKHTDVHFYLLGPTQSYWGDVKSPRQAAKSSQTSTPVQLSFLDEAANQNEPGEMGHLPIAHNPFLSALGQQGREFQNMLLEAEPPELDVESFESHEVINSCLQAIQQSIFENEALPVNDREPDASIRLQACHSPLREVQVLKDQLLDLIVQQPNLAWRDMVIMAPDIQSYAPFIEAVFADVPHSIADKTLKAESMAVEAFSLFLTVIQGRFGWEGVLDLLAIPVVHEAFDLTEEELSWVEKWVQDTQIRWGKSAAHRHELGLPAVANNSWQAGLDRMLMGFMLGDGDENEDQTAFFDDVLPYGEIEGSQAQILGKFVQFMQFLFEASEAVKQPRDRLAWQHQLTEFSDRLLVSELEVLAPLKTLLVELVDEDLAAVTQGLTNTLTHIEYDLAVIAAWMAGKVEERKTSTGFLRGQLTFCSMLPMRSIPFQVIGLLGMNEGAFPRIERPLSFDLIAKDNRLGDRSRRADERYQFLEILLSVRHTLLISFIGQSMHNNEALPPAVVVSELLEQLQILTGQKTEHWIQRHPLHPCSQSYFDAQQADSWSFDQHAFSAAQAFYTAKQGRTGALPTPTAWWQGALVAPASQELELADLMNFFKSPQIYFVKHQLDLKMAKSGASQDEKEPFVVDSLEQYLIQNEWLAVLKKSEDLEQANQSFAHQLSASGRWLVGGPGEVDLLSQQAELTQYLKSWQALNLGKPLAKPYFDFQINDTRIQGQLAPAEHYTKAWVVERYAKVKPKDILTAWIVHLAQQVDLSLASKPTYLLMKDQQLVFQPFENDHTQQGEGQAWSFWQDLIELFQRGQTQPSDLIMECAWAWAELKQKQAQGNNRSKKSPLQLAQETFDKLYDPEYKLLYGDLTGESVLTEAIEPLMERVMMPILEQLEDLEVLS